MKEKDLKNGKEFSFKTPDATDDLRIAECSFNDRLNKFCIWFNGQLFTFKSFKGMSARLEKLKTKWELSYEK